jgi:hypothetical protein
MVMTLAMKSLKFWSEMIGGKRRRKATAATAPPTARFIVVTEAIEG